MIQVGLIGYGTVGSGVYERIHQSEELELLLGEPVEVKAILVKDRQKQRATHIPAIVTSEWEQFCEVAHYDVIFEAIGGIESAYLYTKHWLQKGVPVITANKKLVAEKGKELEVLASNQHTYYGYEASVGGGIPIINALKGTLSATAISRVSGILNGTTNYVLTEMTEHNRLLAEALEDAREKGYTESNPSEDLDGYDSWYKIRILSRLCFGEWPNGLQLIRQGISELEDWHVEAGEKFGFTIKLIGEAWKQGSSIVGGVYPAFLCQSEQLTYVNGVTNGISIEGEQIDQLLFIGPGAGKGATANSMIEDFLFHHRFGQWQRSYSSSALLEHPYSHMLVCVTHTQREKALQWVKETGIEVLDTYTHHDGEGWIIANWNKGDLPYPHYPIYGDVSLRKRVKALYSAQFGTI
ncbi:homoserine dehydrogenase [Halalkalibacter sp. AB-rgal2]|uniref:homoserine dehydrogenase n=1 Tax=Halalkalibacter sp. AB-rgal2 TaxID=3242695 RepID=UPI00359EAF15